jgi:hypothetical protein
MEDVMVPRAARNISIETSSGSVCTHWSSVKVNDLWQRISLCGARSWSIQYNLTPVLDGGSLVILVPQSCPASALRVNVWFAGVAFRLANRFTEYIVLVPDQGKLRPMLTIVACFVVMIVITLVLAFLS